jgi:hypothetical protein
MQQYVSAAEALSDGVLRSVIIMGLIYLSAHLVRMISQRCEDRAPSAPVQASPGPSDCSEQETAAIAAAIAAACHQYHCAGLTSSFPEQTVKISAAEVPGRHGSLWGGSPGFRSNRWKASSRMHSVFSGRHWGS